MHFDIHFRSDVVDKIKDVVGEMHTWNTDNSRTEDETKELTEHLVSFSHCAQPDHEFMIGGADGSGDFPCVAYNESVIYLVTSTARLYKTGANVLNEVEVKDNDIVDFLWVPEDKEKGRIQFLNTFSSLMGSPLEDVCSYSDYFELTKRYKGISDASALTEKLIIPAAHDANNISIQLYSVAEPAVLVKLMRQMKDTKPAGQPVYIIEDTTLALPMATSKSTLFLEIAKRYACEYARKHGFVYMTISKSHNMPHMDQIEDEIAKVNPSGEHWFIRIPSPSTGDRKPEFLGTRTIPPLGAVSYIFKLHNSTQPMRLDMSLRYWQENIFSEDKDEQRRREIQMFRDLDFASHDQRCYGYPYPIKASHDMASMTDDERVALRNQIIDEAVKAGLKRKNFVDPSILTGHK